MKLPAQIFLTYLLFFGCIPDPVASFRKKEEKLEAKDMEETKDNCPTTETNPGDSNMLRTSSTLTLAAADAIANAAISAVDNLKKPSPVAVTVLDNAGNIIVQKRMDGCPAGAYAKFSYAKARTCVHLTASSRTFREKYTGSGEAARFTQAASMVSVMEGELIPVAGGVLIKSATDGGIVGAVGVSGAAADEDEFLAIQGVLLGVEDGFVVPEPAEHQCKTCG